MVLRFIYIRAKATSLLMGSERIQFAVYICLLCAATEIKEKIYFRFRCNIKELLHLRQCSSYRQSQGSHHVSNPTVISTLIFSVVL